MATASSLRSGSDFTPTIHNDTYAYISPLQHNLTGRAILITGASKGVGRATALSYAKAGASHMAIGARSSLASLETEIQAAAKAAKRPEPQLLCLHLDVSSLASVTHAAATVEKHFGRLDILINNAGHLEPFLPLASSAPDPWWTSFSVNVQGTYLTTRAFIPLLLASSDSLSTILNLSSLAANIVLPGGSGYQLTKLAVQRLAEFVQLEYGEQGVLCYAVHPGGVRTELALGMPEAVHAMLVDEPALAGDTFVWLTSERRVWLGGRYVSANWDMRELLEKREKIEKGDLLKIKLDVGM